MLTIMLNLVFLRLMETEGIIVGCDRNQEWLLTWWWKHYTAHNDFPVAFADFGMSEAARKWCQERGQLFDLAVNDYSAKEFWVSSEEKKEWEESYGPLVDHFDSFRSAWFKKPFAALHSPFSRSVWIDLDCEIRGSLTPLFRCLDFPIDIAVRLAVPKKGIYNSGVLVFRRGAEIIRQWAKEAFEHSDRYVGDDIVLSAMIFKYCPALLELPEKYNSDPRTTDPHAVVIHYISVWKSKILESMRNSEKHGNRFI